MNFFDIVLTFRRCRRRRRRRLLGSGHSSSDAFDRRFDFHRRIGVERSGRQGGNGDQRIRGVLVVRMDDDIDDRWNLIDDRKGADRFFILMIADGTRSTCRYQMHQTTGIDRIRVFFMVLIVVRPATRKENVCR